MINAEKSKSEKKMLRRDYVRQAHIVQPTKKKRPASIIQSAVKTPPDLGDLVIDQPPSNPNIKQYRPIQTPQSDISSSSSIIFSVSSTNFQNDHELYFEFNPPLLQIPEQERLRAFIQRVSQCLSLCNFRNPEIQSKVDDKTKALTDILCTLKRSNIIESFGNEEYQYIFRLFLVHSNRTAPNDTKIRLSMMDAEQTMQFKEDAWDHISIAYDILIELITSRKFNQKLCKQSQLQKITYTIVNMFSSLDAREREKLSKLFHHHYVTLVGQRASVRKLTNDFFIGVVQGTQNTIGVSELIQSYLPIVSGFKVPLLSDHILTYKTVILPLHKCEFLQKFHVGLVNVISVYCDKQRSLGYAAIDYILSVWPLTASMKEINFLLEAGHLVEICGGDIPQEILIRLSTRVAKCAYGPSFTLCERTLMMWQSDVWSKTIATYAPDTFRILLPALYKTVKMHWCEEVRKLAITTIVAIKQSNPSVFDMIGSEMKSIESERINSEGDRVSAWRLIALQASLPEDKINSMATSLQIAAFAE